MKEKSLTRFYDSEIAIKNLARRRLPERHHLLFLMCRICRISGVNIGVLFVRKRERESEGGLLDKENAVIGINIERVSGKTS